MKLKSLSYWQILFLLAKLYVLLLLFSADVSDFIIENATRRTHDQFYWKFASVFCFSLAGLLSIGLASLSRSFLIRFVTMLVVVLLILVNLIADKLTGAHLDSDFMVEIIEVFDDVAVAFIFEYLYALFFAISGAVCAALLLSYTPKKAQISSYFALFMPLLLALTFTIQWFLPRMDVPKFSPSPFGLPVHLTNAYIKIYKINSLKRAPLDYAGGIASEIDKIVLIIDESLYGKALSINGAPVEITPYLSNNVNNIINFGVGGSSTNRSAPSNLILRTGLPADTIPDNKYSAFTRPTIWQYAKKAGYKSIYINAWPSVYQNFMLVEEIGQIDEIYGGYSGERKYSDFLAASRLREELKSKNKTFIILQKEGSHWPYSASYPKGRELFYPVVTGVEFLPMPGRSSNVYNYTSSVLDVKPLVDNEGIENFIKKLDEMTYKNISLKQRDSGSQRLNSYYNAVNWSVDEFFRFLFKDLDLRDTVIIFTSDHGQHVSRNFEQSGLYRGHGSVDSPNPEEGIVPFIVFTDNDKLNEKFKESAAESFGKITHFEIFPTLVKLMGFNPAWVRGNLGRSFLDPVESEQFFYYGSSIFTPGNVRKYSLD